MRFSLFIFGLFTFITSIDAQKKAIPEKWVGVNNLFFWSSKENSEMVNERSQLLISEHYEKIEFSIGLRYRIQKETGFYHDINFILFDWKSDESSVSSPLYIIGGETKNDLFIRSAYKIGKLFPVARNLNGDVGIKGIPFYEKNDIIPAIGPAFPIEKKSIGLGFGFDVGVNYRIRDRFIISYDVSLARFDAYWNQELVRRPDVPERKTVTREIKTRANFLGSLLDFRNISLNYIIASKTKKKRKRGRRRF